LRIGVIDSSSAESFPKILKELREKDVLVLNKSDLASNPIANVSRETLTVLHMNAQEPSDVARLRKILEDEVVQRYVVGDEAGLTRARHKDCVKRALTALERAKENLSYAPELAGDDIRTALHALKELAGQTDIESVFDRIFSRFCVGK